MQAQWSKTKTGLWALRVTIGDGEADPKAGDQVVVSKRDGTSSTEIVESIEATLEGGKQFLVTVKKKPFRPVVVNAFEGS